MKIIGENTNFKKIFLYTIIYTLVVSAFYGIYTILTRSYGEDEAKVLLTTLTLIGYSLTGLCSSILHQRRKLIPFAVIGMLVSLIGFLFTSAVIWEYIDINNNVTWKIILIFIIISGGMAHSSLLFLADYKKLWVRTILICTIIAISIVAQLLTFAVLFNGIIILAFAEWIGVFTILIVLGTILIPIINKAQKI